MPSRFSLAARLLIVRGITHADLAAHIERSPQSVSFQLDGTHRLKPELLAAIVTESGGDYSFAASVQDAARDAWLTKHPGADPADHLQSVREAVAG